MSADPTDTAAPADAALDPACIFCAIVAGNAPSRPVYEDEHTLAFLDINPITEGHTLVIPKRHAVDLHDTPAEDLAAAARSSKTVANLLTDRLGCDGINLLHATGVAAWQTVFHLHIHVLPRVKGDIRFPSPTVGQRPKSSMCSMPASSSLAERVTRPLKPSVGP